MKSMIDIDVNCYNQTLVLFKGRIMHNDTSTNQSLKFTLDDIPHRKLPHPK